MSATSGGTLGVGARVAIAALVLGVIATVGGVVGAVALRNLTDARDDLVEEVQPARVATVRLRAALLDQQTGVRRFLLTGDRASLRPYDRGRVDEAAAIETLDARAGALGIADELAQTRARIATWRTEHAEPAIRRRRELTAAESAFDAVRRTLDRQSRRLDALRDQAVTDLDDATDRVQFVFAGFVLLLIGGVLGTVVMLQRTVTMPLRRLAAATRAVREGTFDRPVVAHGPRDVVELGTDVEAMRQRLVAELAKATQARVLLDERTRDLERSNAELEQFAYVASHDLQEPLRKVASFTQLIERRYRDKLDERGVEYIDFAVDGARRMQILINDLLSFSRVGRMGAEQVDVPLDEVREQSLKALATAIEESGATIESDPLPVVRGERSLLAVVFQNLIGNAIKFRGDDPPHIAIGCRRDGDCYELTLADNGMGIEETYAERIFIIFQRLHRKEEFPGTGIGLAMCRKIIEYHGGRIWLDRPDGTTGSTFRFTLPVPDTEAPE